jgi:hypothetical protein
MSVALFTKITARLEELLDIYEAAIIVNDGSDADNDAIAEAADIIDTLAGAKDLLGDWEKRVAFSGSEQAAQIVAGMLADWKLAGAVWFDPKTKRFRLVGDAYKAARREICCGVYLPTATAKMLQEDFAEVMGE